MRSPSLITAIVLSVTTTVLADQPQVDNNAVRWTLQAGVVHQSSASLDEGGDMSAGRYFVSGGLGKVFGGRWRLGVSLNYGEAQSGESRKDFVHKMKVVLKELKETFICLKIIERAKLFKTQSEIEKAKLENNELISIFVKSIETAQKNMKNLVNVIAVK